jgi:hypothetical protein
MAVFIFFMAILFVQSTGLLCRKRKWDSRIENLTKVASTFQGFLLKFHVFYD